MKKLTRLSSDDDQRRTINALVQRVHELEAVQTMLLQILRELEIIEEDQLAARIADAIAPVRAVPGVNSASVLPREGVPSSEQRGGPYREALIDLSPRVVVCDSCGEAMASDRALFDDFGGCVCEDCFNAARLGR
jgi:hypothetical protein